MCSGRFIARIKIERENGSHCGVSLAKSLLGNRSPGNKSTSVKSMTFIAR